MAEAAAVTALSVRGSDTRFPGIFQCEQVAEIDRNAHLKKKYLQNKIDWGRALYVWVRDPQLAFFAAKVLSEAGGKLTVSNVATGAQARVLFCGFLPKMHARSHEGRPWWTRQTSCK